MQLNEENIGSYEFDLARHEQEGWSKSMLAFASGFNALAGDNGRELKRMSLRSAVPLWEGRPFVVSPAMAELVQTADANTAELVRQLFRNQAESSSPPCSLNFGLRTLFFGMCSGGDGCACTHSLEPQLFSVGGMVGSETFHLHAADGVMVEHCLRPGTWRSPTFEECLLWGYRSWHINRDRIAQHLWA